MSFFPEPYSDSKTKDELDLSNYETKSGLKEATDMENQIFLNRFI